MGQVLPAGAAVSTNPWPNVCHGSFPLVLRLLPGEWAKVTVPIRCVALLASFGPSFSWTDLEFQVVMRYVAFRCWETTVGKSFCWQNASCDTQVGFTMAGGEDWFEFAFAFFPGYITLEEPLGEASSYATFCLAPIWWPTSALRRQCRARKMASRRQDSFFCPTGAEDFTR